MNQLGDFLTGIVAPLAFLWLVVGYRIQAIEFRAQSEELGNQTEQLRAEVEETRRLTELAVLQSKELRSRMAPSFEVKYFVKQSGSESSSHGYTSRAFALANHGNLVRNVQVYISAPNNRIRRFYNSFESNWETEFFSGGGSVASFENPIVGVIRCDTLLQEKLYFSFFVNRVCDSCPLFSIVESEYRSFLEVAMPEAKEGKPIPVSEVLYGADNGVPTPSGNRISVIAEAKKLYAKFKEETRLDTP